MPPPSSKLPSGSRVASQWVAEPPTSGPGSSKIDLVMKKTAMAKEEMWSQFYLIFLPALPGRNPPSRFAPPVPPNLARATLPEGVGMPVRISHAYKQHAHTCIYVHPSIHRSICTTYVLVHVHIILIWHSISSCIYNACMHCTESTPKTLIKRIACNLKVVGSVPSMNIIHGIHQPAIRHITELQSMTAPKQQRWEELLRETTRCHQNRRAAF